MEIAPSGRRVDLQTPKEDLRGITPLRPLRITEAAVIRKGKTPVERKVAALAAGAKAIEMPDSDPTSRNVSRPGSRFA